ncbi:MAG: hypothetical protein JNM98_01630, partial [Rhodocyclaceae bacterium]|nr:hypothetical protein [Rhodocyclaceae bacterium]
DIILHGHLHENSVASVASSHGTTLMLAAGASYQTRQWPNRAMFVTVEGSTARVFPLRYEDSPTEIWTLDTSLFPHDKDYEGEFPLPGRQSPQPAASAQAATLPGAKPAPETPSDQPNTLEVRIQGQLCAELAKDTCLPITRALLRAGSEGQALPEKIAAWWEGSENALKRIKELTAAVSEALQPKPAAPQAFAAHAQKLLGLVALGALRPEALADLAGDAGALRELDVQTVVGVELVFAARGGLDTIVFVLAGAKGKRVHPERALLVEPNFPESGWDASTLAKDAADQIVRPLLDIPASQRDLSTADYDHAAAALRDKGAYFAVSRLESPGHPLLDAEVRAALPEPFRDFPIMVFGINARERSKLFNVREGELRHAIQTFLETLRGHNPN